MPSLVLDPHTMTLKQSIKTTIPFTTLMGYLKTYGDNAYCLIARDLGLMLRPEPDLHASMKKQIEEAALEAQGEMWRANQAALEQ